ncbi:MAG: HNH endonuclease [bacterium]
MSDWIHIEKDQEHIAREKIKAQKLRKMQWWKNKISQGICYYCQKKFKPHELTMDHKIPLSRGGKSNKGNVVPCCEKCNKEKKYYTPVDMILQKLRKDSE